MDEKINNIKTLEFVDQYNNKPNTINTSNFPYDILTYDNSTIDSYYGLTLRPLAYIIRQDYNITKIFLQLFKTDIVINGNNLLAMIKGSKYDTQSGKYISIHDDCIFVDFCYFGKSNSIGFLNEYHYNYYYKEILNLKEVYFNTNYFLFYKGNEQIKYTEIPSEIAIIPGNTDGNGCGGNAMRPIQSQYSKEIIQYMIDKKIQRNNIETKRFNQKIYNFYVELLIKYNNNLYYKSYFYTVAMDFQNVNVQNMDSNFCEEGIGDAYINFTNIFNKYKAIFNFTSVSFPLLGLAIFASKDKEIFKIQIKEFFEFIEKFPIMKKYIALFSDNDKNTYEYYLKLKTNK